MFARQCTCRIRNARLYSSTANEAWSLLTRRDTPRSVETNDRKLQNAFRKTNNTKPSSCHLTISGLSAHVRQSDFYRSPGSGLAGWNIAPTQGALPLRRLPPRIVYLTRAVLQDRNHRTFEPTGSFTLTFEDQTHRDNYKAQLSSSSTIAPPNSNLYTVRESKRPRLQWTRHLQNILREDGHGETPPAVLFHLSSPLVSTDLVRTLVDNDSADRDCEWRVSQPHHLWEYRDGTKVVDEDIENGDADSKVYPSWVKLRSRFVFSCEDVDEARRFQRRWNAVSIDGEELELPGDRVTISASLIEW